MNYRAYQKERDCIEHNIADDPLYAAEIIVDALGPLRDVVGLADLGTIPRGAAVEKVRRAITELEKLKSR